MPIVGGLDIHRKQLTFDYLDTATGEVKRGQIAPADRAHLRDQAVSTPVISFRGAAVPVRGAVVLAHSYEARLSRLCSCRRWLLTVSGFGQWPGARLRACESQSWPG